MNAIGPVRLVACLAFQFGLCSVVYFLSLVAGAPFWAAALACGAGCLGLVIWSIKQDRNAAHERGLSPWTLPILAAGITLLFFNSFAEMEAWGGWDAWAIWNHRAAMLESPNAWHAALDLEASAHPDYPLGLPAGVAFLNRLFPGLDDGTVAIAVAWGATFAIVFLLFAALSRQLTLMGAGALFYLATNARFLHHGLSQYADTLLGLYLLLAVMSYRAASKDACSGTAMICGAALGLCIWTKNEGCILAALAFVFWMKRMLSARFRWPFLAGLLLPLAVWLIFKITLAPPGDMLYDAGAEVWLQRLGDIDRYTILWEKLYINIQADYTVPTLLLLVYILIRIRLKRAPGADFGFLCTSVLAYGGVYLLTPAPLEWQLDTSLSRLLHQLLPSVLLVCGSELAHLRVQPIEQLGA